MNFNQHANEYDLSGSITEELIRLYGTQCKLVITSKINRDLTFGDFSHIKSDNRSCFEVFAMPENSEEFEQYERLQSQFGIPTDTTINLYVSKICTYKLIQESQNSKNDYDVTEVDERIHNFIGSLFIIPSGKILEITDITLDCFGLNNVFLYNQQKNVYKFKCKTYIHKVANELEKYFDELTEIKEKQDLETNEYYRHTDDVFGRF